MLTAQDTLNDVVAREPRSADLLAYHQLHADGRTIAQAAADAGLCGCELKLVLQLLLDGGPNPLELSAAELIDHIVGRHHRFLKEQLPAGSRLLAEARRLAGQPRMLDELINVHESLRGELEMHLLKEERILFPMLLGQMEPCGGCGQGGRFDGPIAQMRLEHDQGKTALRQIKSIRLGGRLVQSAMPPDLLSRVEDYLQRMHDDLVLHMYLENQILFPRVSDPSAVETGCK